MVEFYFLCVCIIILILGFLFGFRSPKQPQISEKFRIIVYFKDDFEDYINSVSLGDFNSYKEALNYLKETLKEDSDIMNYYYVEIIYLKDNTLVFKEYK